jgi:hypothetical protein
MIDTFILVIHSLMHHEVASLHQLILVELVNQSLIVLIVFIGVLIYTVTIVDVFTGNSNLNVKLAIFLVVSFQVLRLIIMTGSTFLFLNSSSDLPFACLNGSLSNITSLSLAWCLQAARVNDYRGWLIVSNGKRGFRE